MCGLESGYRIYDTNFLKEKAREGINTSDFRLKNFNIFFNIK